MHSIEIQNRFLELRAKGMSLARIAKKIGVSKRTLVDWNRDRAQEVLSLRALELEALNEKLLATREHELKWMTQMLRNAEECLLERELKYQSTGDVWRILTYLRAELDKRRLEPSAGLSQNQVGTYPQDKRDGELPNPVGLSRRDSRSVPDAPAIEAQQPKAPDAQQPVTQPPPPQNDQFDQYSLPPV